MLEELVVGDFHMYRQVYKKIINEFPNNFCIHCCCFIIFSSGQVSNPIFHSGGLWRERREEIERTLQWEYNILSS